MRTRKRNGATKTVWCTRPCSRLRKNMMTRLVWLTGEATLPWSSCKTSACHKCSDGTCGQGRCKDFMRKETRRPGKL